MVEYVIPNNARKIVSQISLGDNWFVDPFRPDGAEMPDGLRIKALAGGKVTAVQGDPDAVRAFAARFPGGRFSATAFERGGAMSSWGEAEVVAGPDGRPLRPVYVRTRGHRACEKHAFFVGRALAQVGVYRHFRTGAENAWVRLFTVDPNGEERVILHWEDDIFVYSRRSGGMLIFSLPGEVARFADAIVTAREKAGVYHCRDVFYAL